MSVGNEFVWTQSTFPIDVAACPGTILWWISQRYELREQHISTILWVDTGRQKLFPCPGYFQLRPSVSYVVRIVHYYLTHWSWVRLVFSLLCSGIINGDRNSLRNYSWSMVEAHWNDLPLNPWAWFICCIYFAARWRDDFTSKGRRYLNWKIRNEGSIRIAHRSNTWVTPAVIHVTLSHYACLYGLSQNAQCISILFYLLLASLFTVVASWLHQNCDRKLSLLSLFTNHSKG